MGKVLNKADILAAADIIKEEVDCPEWGGSVFITTLSGADFVAFQGSVYSRDGKKVTTDEQNFQVKLIIKTAVDDAGVCIFGEKDIEELKKKSAKPIQRLFDVASRLNGLSKEAVEEKKENFS